MPRAEGGWRLARICGELAAVADGVGDHVSFTAESAHLFDANTGEALAHGP
jgi:hypothetical protein